MNSTKKTSVFANALIWFGAGVSIAEILTGTYYSTLGFGKGLAAILIGHLIGGVMMFAAGLIGGLEEKSAMETVKMSFGEKGSLLFVLLNVLQLVGWTAIMIYDGALAAGGIVALPGWVWPLVIGGLIIVWILIGLTNLGKVNTVAMAALLILCLILCFVIFGGLPKLSSTTVSASALRSSLALRCRSPGCRSSATIPGKRKSLLQLQPSACWSTARSVSSCM